MIAISRVHFRRTLLALVLAALGLPGPLLADRRPIFEQIDLPHPYYYHEMYLPQLTGGPSSVTFSPDSKEVIYSMAGSLWRQRLDSATAVQLTDGPGYDYQPDWSPDGRSVVYVSYRNSALELWMLDLASRGSRQLTSGGAVNVEPRWSPDGTRIAFVSTAYNKHFHVFLADVAADHFGPPVRLTGETKSPLRRYYYSAFDHELSPVWTRDGRSLIYVSNRGHIHGTGGFWQIEARPGSEGREIHYEETNWRARPDVSPDGSRLVYSSYLGRNWHQLWLLPVGGGDAFPISYGEFDAVGARFSPDGREIAYISNASGGLELWLHTVAGGAERALVVTERRTLKPTGHLELSIKDGAGGPGAARVSVTDAEGRFHAPAGAWIHGDDGFDRAERPFEAHYFHARGEVALDVPAGLVQVEFMRGFRYPLVSGTVIVKEGATVRLGTSAPHISSPAAGGGRWVSGDVHVHMNYGGLYRNTPAHLIEQAAAEDLDIVHAVLVNKEQRMPDIAYGAHGLDPASTAEHLVVHGQEFHTSYWGHLGVLGPASGPLLPGYAGYPNTAAASLAPTNADIADLAHARGALVGYVHPFDEEPHPFNVAEPLSMELPVDVALGKVDYIEILGFSDHRITASVWYRLLNLGFRLPAAGGTDAMPDYASLRGPVGMNRVFVRVSDGPLDDGEWLAALKAGRSFATNGPLLEFTLGGVPVGSELHYKTPLAAVPFTAHLRSIVPVDHLEVVCNGAIVRVLRLKGARTEADATGSVPAKRSGWCLLRASSDRAQYPVLDNYVYATTSPVYVTVEGAPVRASADANYFSAWVDRVTESTSRYPDWNSAAEKAAVLAELAAAREVYEKLK
ncbi:MAG TPA: CehA/McbA family metallohydrolase [Steroidobacteraceae bacterium]|nr:CehA/McbA family metallohydrolase [Steroidobacteraceae bacterium]